MAGSLLSTLGIVCPACDRLHPAGSPRCSVCGVSFSTPAIPTPLVQGALEAHARPKPPVLSRHAPKLPPVPPRADELSVQRTGFVLAVLSGGAKGERYPIPISGAWVGRQRGDILFAEDVFVSGHHAAISIHQGRLHIRDEGTASGVFVSIAGPEMIAHGALFAVGRRLLRFLGHLQPAVAAIAGGARVYGAPLPQGQPPYGIEEVLVGGRTGRAVISVQPSLTVGQMNCDFCFPHDDSVATAHCEVAPCREGALLKDLSAGIGTFLRITPGADRAMNVGDQIRIGQQILQVEAA